MPQRVVVDDDEQQIADLIKAVRRLRARLATGQVRGTHDEFTVAAPPNTIAGTDLWDDFTATGT